jgi:hypothetical protein
LSTAGSICAGSRVTTTSITVGRSRSSIPRRNASDNVSGFLNADAAAAHRAGDRGVIHLDQVGRLIAAAHHRVLQRFDVTRRGVVDDNHREPEPGAARGFQIRSKF